MVHDPTNRGAPLNIAVDQLLAVADITAAEYRCSPVDLLVFAAVYALMPHMSRREALAVFANAREQLSARGIKEK
jgi:hypothetical protein